MRTEAQRLFAEAEIRAERTAAILRATVALLLGGALFLAVAGPAVELNAALTRQLRIAVAVLAGYFALGLLAFAVARPGLFRPWMPWAFATLDVGFIALSVSLNLANIALPSNYAASLPVVWLIPLVLAFAAMRYNPHLQGYVALLLVVGLAPAAGLGGGGWLELTSSPS